MMSAYGLIDKNLVKENIEINKELHIEDGEWILELSDMLEKRWKEKVLQQKEFDIAFRNKQKNRIEQPAETELSMEQQIVQSEEEHRKFLKEYGDKIAKVNEKLL